MKSRLKYLSLIFVVLISSCSQKNDGQEKAYMEVNGMTQGTTYMIKYSTQDTVNLRPQFEKILANIDSSMSTYNKQSVISKVNTNQTSINLDSYFKDVFNTAMKVSRETDGAFDITVAPLVNAWGFGFKELPEVDSAKVDSIMDFVGHEKVKMEEGKIYKEDKRIMLDMNAIAQGYTVDVIARYLDSINIDDYLVEVGGEVKTKGKSPSNKAWRVGIDKPVEGNDVPGRNLQAIIRLENQSLATSGNYRKYYVKDGIKYSHTIDPSTGYPVKHNLLSVTVLADQCVRADAYATAFMVMGLEKSQKMVNNIDDIEAYFIYSDTDGDFKVAYSNKIKKLITRIE
jgi:thiamine biosynthesis lipoprotein